MERREVTGRTRLVLAIPFLLLVGMAALLAPAFAPYGPLAIDARNTSGRPPRRICSARTSWAATS